MGFFELLINIFGVSEICSYFVITFLFKFYLSHGAFFMQIHFRKHFWFDTVAIGERRLENVIFWFEKSCFLLDLKFDLT